MIVAAVFCPHPPLLVPELAGSAAPELDELRAHCSTALGALEAASPERILVVGTSAVSAVRSSVSRGSLAGYGLDREFALGSPGCGGRVDLPLSLTIGAFLLEQHVGPRSEATGIEVGPDFGSTPAAVELLRTAETARGALLVMGDGSARRSTAAPGYLDERAEAFDAEVAAALGSGDGDALTGLSEELGADLLAAGVPAWRAAGSLLAGGGYRAQLQYSGAPYGVGYFVASWTAVDA